MAISRDVLADLLRLVSERTGYPAEMLDPALNIEADLGIDSIKRVEILSAFQRSCSPGEQSAIQRLMDRLTSLKTLRDIAAAIGGALAPAADATAPATAVTAPAPAAERRDVMTELVELVSERTGYPKEMLDPDLNIEADLGIDSIKRVEILSTFQRRGSADEQRRVHEAMETLTSRKTLRELARSLSDALVQSEGPAVAPGMPEASSTAAEQESADEADAPRFVMQAVDTPITEPARLFPGRLWLITDDEHGVAESVAASLTKAGEPSVLLRHGGTVSRIDSHAYTVDLADAAQVAQVLGEIQRTRGVPGGLLHLLPLKPATAWDQMSTGEWRERMTADVKTLYTLVRAMSSDLVAAGPQKGAMLVAATGMGSALTGGDADFPPSHGGIAGFLKTAAIELSTVTCRAVHLDASDTPARAIDHILSEIGCHDASIECAYGRQRRVTFLPQLAPAASNSTTTGLGPESVFLITGGARGITAEIAAAIARAVRPRIFIVGRSPRPVPEASLTAGVESTQQLRQALTKAMRAADGNVKPSDIEAAVQRVLRDREIRRALTAAERAGAAVEYIEVDVRDETAFAAVIDRIYADHGRLDVVVHGAGIIEDKLLKDKTPESFDRVVGTKTDSAFTLMRQLRPASLKVLIFMSSVTATFGNRGQADYGAANGVLNAAAAILARRWPGRVRAINWGPWDKAGMVSDEVKRQFATRGIRVIPIAAGTAVALREILAGEGRDPIVVVGDGPWRSETARTARTHEVELTA